MTVEEVKVYAVGDVCVDREDPDSYFALSASTLQDADIAFCQLETNYSERGAPQFVARAPLRAHPRNATALKKAGFHVVSFASNHCGDWGHDALLDTIDVVKENKLEIVGVGRNIAEARTPVIVEKKGTKVAFLAYCSILPYRYWAEEERPGCAPLRGFTVYEQEETDQPGTPATAHSFTNPADLQALKDDIKKVRSLADIVIVSHHGGLHFVPAQIPDYQKEVAHTAIDAGADLILGHHAHILKGIEVYKGKVIFYSLCNFGFDLKLPEKFLQSPKWKVLMELNPSWEIDPDYPTYPFPADSRKTILAKCIISDKEIRKVSFLPVYINGKGQPEVLASGDKRCHGVFDYMNWVCEKVGFDTKLSLEGGEVRINI